VRRFARIDLVVAALVAVAAATAVGSPAATPGIPSIYVDYNQNCTFSMSVDPGTQLPPSAAPGVTLPPGTYQLLISMLNPSSGYAPCSTPTFTLTGPGVGTQVAFAGVELHEERLLTFQPSATYVAQDENAPASTRRLIATAASGSTSSLLGSGTTQSSGTGSVQSSDYVGSAILRYCGKLAATVSPAGKATLKLRGRSVGSLKAGKYDIVVDDRDARDGFSLKHGKQEAVAVTSPGFTGKRTKRMTLGAGKWSFFSKPGATVQFTVAP
jgi:hypothetical protein